MPNVKKVFISFDYEHDNDIKCDLAAKLKHKVNIAIVDNSIAAPIIDERWQREARRRIEQCDYVIFLCGEHTHQASGVEAEMTITSQLHKPYFFIRGRTNAKVNFPKNAPKGRIQHRSKIKVLTKLLNGELE